MADPGPALFLLGDLFEYWVGDDHSPPVAVALCNALRALAGEGWRVYLMHGNRDFLMGAEAARACAATLLPDPCLIVVDGERVVLTHGDAQCIDDTRYQQWRALCRSPQWQQDFLARPLSERLQMAAALREQSRAAQAMTETTADVDQATIDALLDAHVASGLIHGHTHRPGMHHWRNSGVERWRRVLSDWESTPPRGEILDFAHVRAG